MLVICDSNRARQNWGFKVLKDRKMERFCEFCLALRPVVYCKADAAHLCLSCDAKVHSANTLFNRHMRSILCDSCRDPAYIQCLDHKMFMCCACESALHMIASQHQKKAISSYTEQIDLSSSVLQTSKRLNVHLDQRLQHSQNSGTKFRQRDSLVQELKVDHLSFPFSQIEHMQPSSTTGLLLHTESFWQCRSMVQSNQLWPQNMHDIGVCKELVCPDDFNIPDVDMTFQNFEELFGGDQDPIRAAVLHDKDVSYSLVEKGISVDKSDNGNASAVVV
ncbi:putative zinc finger protein At1g68190 [Pyrus x bretschneideri]|uniref:putative zinc finger protein At1g68190 n=1 Tax=Pyrus x bretschneideri TaxID=225117 RepID=UPI002030538B|nr:putative zinc finger protein At1g68190 [Pyrus x bretschneideri]